MDHEAEMIRHQMEETRSSLQNKVEQLERQIEDTVTTVRDTFDLKSQVKRHPWTMFCGAAAVGFLGARLLEGMWAESPKVSRSAAPLPDASLPWIRKTSRHWWDSIADQYRDEIQKVKGLTLATLGSLVGESLTEVAPPALKERIKEVVDSVTAKLGAEPLKEPLSRPSSPAPRGNGRGNGIQGEEASSSPGSKRREWGPDRFDI